MMRAVDHVSFTVFDLDRSIEFYRVLLGDGPVHVGVDSSAHTAKVVGYDPIELRYAWFQLPGTPTMLELFEYATPRGQRVDLENYFVGNGHLGFAVDDIEREQRRLAAAGATFASPAPIDCRGAWEGTRVLYMRDPDGITIELMESPPVGEARFGR